MIIPNNYRCKEVIEVLADEPSLTDWESNFVHSNLKREEFTDAQREVIANLMDKYDC